MTDLSAAAPSGLLLTPSDDLCLEFADTLFWRGTHEPTETLNGIGDLLDWAMRSKSLPAQALERFRAAWLCSGEDIADVFDEAVRLRERIYRVFAAIASGREPATQDL